MQYTLILARFLEVDLAPVKDLVTCVQQQVSKSRQQDGHAESRQTDSETEDTVLSFCCVDHTFERVLRETESSMEENWAWRGLTSVDVDTALQEMQAVSVTHRSGNVQKTTKLSEHLDNLADSLPYSGFTLDVFLVNPNVSRESCTPLLGSLMRLREWHAGQVTMVTEAADQQGDTVQLLASILQANILHSSQLSLLHWPLWRGVVVWPSEKGFVQPGVSLECGDFGRLKDKLITLHFWKRKRSKKHDPHEAPSTELVFGRRLEVLTFVSLASVPLYLIDSFSLLLHVKPDSQFGQLANTLTHKEALLVRLSLHEKCCVPVAASCGLSTAAWKEGIAAAGRPTPDPEKEPLACRQHLFLLIPGEQEVTGQLTAIILRSPSEVNGEVFEELHRATYFGFQTNSEISEEQTNTQDDIAKSAEKAVQDLPLLTASVFHTVDSVLLESVVQYINKEKSRWEKKGKAFELTAGDLIHCITEGQETLLQQGEKQASPGIPEGRTPLTSHDFLFLPDLQGPPSEWPERRALLESESKAKVLRRYQSNDSCSMMLSSPLAPDESSMDAKDMVRWFKPDGSAVREDLSPVKAVVRPHRLSSHEERNLQWPACKDLHYHDVYYEHNKRCEKQEQFFQKFRDTIMLEESHHVCSDKPHIPALRFRGHPHKSQLDVSCGGSKLTPITRTLSSSSMLPMTPSAKQRRSLKSAEGCGRRESVSRQDGGRFPAPKSRVKREKSWSGSGDGTGSGKWTHSQESLWSVESSDTGNGSSRRSLHLQPSASTPTLPPFRKLSQSSDIVNIFTPPMSQNRQSHAASNSSVWDSDSSRVKQSASASTVTSAGDSQEQRLSWDDGDGQASAGNTTPLPKEPRSQRHKRRLEQIVSRVLINAGVNTSDIIYTSCFTKLFQVTKFFVTQLPDSHNLKAEMRSIAEKQVQQVVDLERRRQDLAVKKKLRKSSLVADR